MTNPLVSRPDKPLDMRITCVHAQSMPKMLQVRNVPDALHHRLKVRAATNGETLTDYVLEILRRADREPTIDEWLAELRNLPVTRLAASPAAEIRKARASR